MEEREWYWCQHCEKAYQETEDGKCPYCGAQTAFDGWRWVKVRKLNPRLPEVPEEGKEYWVPV